MAYGNYGLPQGGSISIRHGSEGPAHDPYSFTEITVQRHRRPAVTIHSGLGCWTCVNGRKFSGGEELVHYDRFVNLVGVSPDVIVKWCAAVDARAEAKLFRETGMTNDDIRDAERAAGWDPNP